MEQQIICPSCGSVIRFEEGTIVERCIACKQAFVNPKDAPIKVSATATVVELPVVNLTGGVNNVGGN